MKPTISREDTLSQISYSGNVIKADDPSLLRNQVSSTDGRVVIVSAFGCSLVLNYSFGALDIHVTVVLETPVGSITIINVNLDPTNPTIKLGGIIDSFKAEASVSFSFSSLELTATGEICAPLVGC